MLRLRGCVAVVLRLLLLLLPRLHGRSVRMATMVGLRCRACHIQRLLPRGPRLTVCVVLRSGRVRSLLLVVLPCDASLPIRPVGRVALRSPAVLRLSCMAIAPGRRCVLLVLSLGGLRRIEFLADGVALPCVRPTGSVLRVQMLRLSLLFWNGVQRVGLHAARCIQRRVPRRSSSAPAVRAVQTRLCCCLVGAKHLTWRPRRGAVC